MPRALPFPPNKATEKSYFLTERCGLSTSPVNHSLSSLSSPIDSNPPPNLLPTFSRRSWHCGAQARRPAPLHFVQHAAARAPWPGIESSPWSVQGPRYDGGWRETEHNLEHTDCNRRRSSLLLLLHVPALRLLPLRC